VTRKLLLAVLLAVGGASLVATGAFVDTPDRADEIEMAPSDGPNSVYAVNDSGEIKLDLSESAQLRATDATGVPDNSVTEVVNIFTVTHDGNTGGSPVEVWFETPDEPAYDDIEFVQGTESVTSIHDRTHSQMLAPGERVHIGVLVDTTGDHRLEAIEEFTLVVETDGDSDGANDGDSDGANDGDSDGGSRSATGSDTGSDTDGGELEDPPTIEGDTPFPDLDLPDVDSDNDDDETPDESATDGTGTLTEPTFPGPEETLGGFLFRTLLLLVAFVTAGTVLFSVTRHGLHFRDGGTR
jgi:hypothetical protein